MFKTITSVRVRYSETDQMRVVYHSHFFQYFEVARSESIRDLGFTYADMEKTGIIMPVVEVQCKYLRPALYDDLLTIHTVVKEMPTAHKILFEHEVYNEQNVLLAVGHVKLYFLEARTMKKTTMPAQLLNKIKAYY